jgi:hypothetical protein
MPNAVDTLLARMHDAGSLTRTCLEPCSSEEVQIVRHHFSGWLPPAYESFLRHCGRGAGRLFAGSEIFYPELLELQDAAAELLAQAGDRPVLPPTAKVFFMHQGYEFCFFTPTASDPPVFQYVEGQPSFTNPWPSFSAFLEESIALHLRTWPDLQA